MMVYICSKHIMLSCVIMQMEYGKILKKANV